MKIRQEKYYAEVEGLHLYPMERLHSALILSLCLEVGLTILDKNTTQFQWWMIPLKPKVFLAVSKSRADSHIRMTPKKWAQRFTKMKVAYMMSDMIPADISSTRESNCNSSRRLTKRQRISQSKFFFWKWSRISTPETWLFFKSALATSSISLHFLKWALEIKNYQRVERIPFP